jgi:lactosylceramide 4-alpha-galactosyltransferase
MIKQHAKIFSIFSLITLSTILFFIQGDHVIHHDSLILHSTQKEHLVMLQAQRSTLSTLNHNHNYKPIISMQEEKLDEVDYANQKVLVAPFNLNKEQRIAWFKENLQEFKILKSDKLAKQFHARIHKFLKNESCESQFFMTWISPSSSFGEREIFSIESLFKVQPQACLTILSRTLDSIHGYKILKPFLDKGFKVQAITPNLLSLFKGTLAESWFHELRKGKKDPGEIPLFQNLSNLIRLVVLYKYGGVYLDTDFILLKPLIGLRNCIGAQSMDYGTKQWTRLNNAVLIFDKNHPLLLRFINEFALTFDGNKWGHNGPYLVSRVVERLEKKHGLKFSILSPLAFYPADWNKISGFFKKPKARSEEKWVEAKLRQLISGKTYGVHLWNKQSSGLVIEEGSVIARLVSNHCVICKV